MSSSGLRLPAFRLVKGGETLPPSRYTRSTRTGSHEATGVLDSAGVFREFAAGATIVFQGLHRSWLPLARFSRQLEIALGHPVQVNAYVTPPGSQGLNPHEDEHDVFVLQSHGTKTWSIFERHDLPPSRPPLIEATVATGDSIYIPEGFPHAATTQQEASVHLTIGILSLTWGSVLAEAVKEAEGDPSLTEPLPIGFAFDEESFRRLVQERLGEISTLVAKADAGSVARRLQRKVLTTRQPVLHGHMNRLLSVDQVGDDTTVRLREDAICVLEPAGDEVALLIGDRELRMPAPIEPALRLIIGRDQLEISELATHLDEKGRMVLVRRLIAEGLLEVVG